MLFRSQATVYALASTEAEDQALRQRSPVLLCISLLIVFLQLVTLVAVGYHTMSPPCNDNNDHCPYDGTFCKARGTGEQARCGTCGNYGPMGYEYDETTGKMYNQMMTDGSNKDPDFVGYNMTHVELVCAKPSLSVSLAKYIPGATCFKPAENPASKRFEDRYEPTVCTGATQIGQPSPNIDKYIELWCEACLVEMYPGGPKLVPLVTGHDVAINNVQNMRATDWVTYFFCALLVALTMVCVSRCCATFKSPNETLTTSHVVARGEIKDIQLCLYAMATAGDKMPRPSRILLKSAILARRWAFLPILLIVVVALVVTQGGAALQVCFNTIAILFTCEVDNVVCCYLPLPLCSAMLYTVPDTWDELSEYGVISRACLHAGIRIRFARGRTEPRGKLWSLRIDFCASICFMAKQGCPQCGDSSCNYRHHKSS
jgi:hypothetical protein